MLKCQKSPLKDIKSLFSVVFYVHLSRTHLLFTKKALNVQNYTSVSIYEPERDFRQNLRPWHIQIMIKIEILHISV